MLIDKLFFQYWKRNWKCGVLLSGKGKHLSGLQKEIKDNSWLKIKSRRIETAITRMRLGHAGINQHLYRFELYDSPLCEICRTPETIEHFLLNCPKYDVFRRRLRATFSDGPWDFTLGNVLCFGDYPTSTLLKQLDALSTFLMETGRATHM